MPRSAEIAEDRGRRLQRAIPHARDCAAASRRERTGRRRSSPSRCACSSTRGAISGAQPNLRDSGHSAPAPSQSMRQNTLEPGAARAIFSTSASQSTANRRTPSSIGARDVALLLDRVAIADAVARSAPAASTCSISTTEAVSKQEPRRASRLEHARIRDWPSPRRTRAYPARPWRKTCNCHARHRGRRTRHGPSSRRLRRNSRIRSVIAASLRRARCAAPKRTSFGVNGDADCRPRFGDATGRVDPPSATGTFPRGRCLADHARSDAAPLDNRTVDMANCAVQSVHGHRLEWDEIPLRTPGKKDKPLRYASFGGRQRRKSPVRRCFKSRPPFGGVRRFASGCRSFFRRLTGLLSGSPPTDTRPQARAKLGKQRNMRFRPALQVIFSKKCGGGAGDWLNLT